MSPRAKGKRVENPVATLLRLLREKPPLDRLTYLIQMLLFFIDKHWTILHGSLQQQIINELLQFVAFDDGSIQSWALLCLAAVAHAGGQTGKEPSSSSSQSTLSSLSDSSQLPFDTATWDPIWTQAMRRVTVPNVCRAACHAAHAIIVTFDSHSNSSSHSLVSSSRVLSEIETFAKDLDAQGPVYPYDSVCMFVAACIRIASQDVRLYRMQLEDKAVTWLLDCWTLSSSTGTPMQMVTDILSLIETICGFSKRSHLVCRSLVPDCLISQVLIQNNRTRILRDYLLYAMLPDAPKEPKSSRPKRQTSSQSGGGLIEPRGRERKIEAFFMRSLEAQVTEWETLLADNVKPRAEKARQSLDASVAVLSFESLRTLNGIRSNRRVVQAAYRIIALVTPLLTRSIWTLDEKAMILLTLEPLVANQERRTDLTPWIAILPPDIGTGIRSRTLKNLLSTWDIGEEHLRLSRTELQRNLWCHADVSAFFLTHSAPSYKFCF